MMQYRLSNKKDEEQIIALFHQVFTDEESYVKLYLDFPCLIAANDNKIVSMLFLLPLEKLNAKYIYAVATEPSYRSKGISTKLLEIANENYNTILSPASDGLVKFYEKRGYKLLTQTEEREFNFESPKLNQNVKESSLLEFKSDIYTSKELMFRELENRYFNGMTYKIGDSFAVVVPLKDYLLVRATNSDDIESLCAYLNYKKAKVSYNKISMYHGNKPNINRFILALD